MSTVDTREHNDSICCICMANEGTQSNFSIGSVTNTQKTFVLIVETGFYHKERIMQIVLYVELCLYGITLQKKNSQCYVDNFRLNGEDISVNLETIIINYINENMMISITLIITLLLLKIIILLEII